MPAPSSLVKRNTTFLQYLNKCWSSACTTNMSRQRFRLITQNSKIIDDLVRGAKCAEAHGNDSESNAEVLAHNEPQILHSSASNFRKNTKHMNNKWPLMPRGRERHRATLSKANEQRITKHPHGSPSANFCS